MYKPPYVGVTGFVSNAEVQAVLDALPANLPRKLMMGVLANRDTLAGKSGPKQFAGRYPKVEHITDIFSDDPRVLNLIHYSSMSEGPTLANEMVEVRTNFGGFICDGIQMNLTWPMPRCVEHYRKLVERSISVAISPLLTNEVIVLQVGREALELCGYNPFAVVKRLRDYEGLVNYVLLDQSGGRGKPFTHEMATLAMIVAYQMPKSMGLVVAGGLSALSVDKTLNLFQLVDLPAIDLTKLSLDAEGRLRNLDDKLIVDAAVAYAKRSLVALHVPAGADED